MTITVTLDLPPDVEIELRKSIAQGDSDRVRQLLADALTPTVEALFRQATGAELDPDEWEQIAERLIGTFAAALPSEVSTLPDDALNRAGIYAEHP
jgi:hypothetical protein